MGRDPKGLYHNEMDLLSSIVKMFTWKEDEHPEISAYGILQEIKRGSSCNFKIKTVKICFVLDNDVHMHKDIDWEAL